MLAEFGYREKKPSSYVVNIEREDGSGPGQGSRSFELFRDMYVRSNSPVLSSSSSSGNDNDNNNNVTEYVHSRRKKTSGSGEYKKLTCADVEASIGRTTVSESDVLAIYLQAQKLMYTKSGKWTSAKLYCITGSAILLSLFITIFSSFLMNRVAIVCVNGAATIMFSVSSYARLDSVSALSFQFADSIENIDVGDRTPAVRRSRAQRKGADSRECILGISAIPAFDEADVQRQLRARSNVPVPYLVARMFPFVSRVDILQMFHSIRALRMQAIEQLTETKNEIGRIVFRWNEANSLEKWKSGEALSLFLQTKQKEETRMLVLMETKEALKKDICEYNKVYDSIADLIQNEMGCAEYMQVWSVLNKNPFHESNRNIIRDMNPGVKKYVSAIAY